MAIRIYFICFLTALIGVHSAPNVSMRDVSNGNRLKIVGGDNATITDYPYQVSVLFVQRGDLLHGCGGSIINEFYILTAAHCTYGETEESTAVRVGSSIRNQGGTVYEVRKIHIHPRYNPETFDYDISVLELTSPLSYEPGVAAITLATEGTEITDGIEAVATGWGYMKDPKQHGILADQLQVVTLPVISTETCQNQYYQGAVSDRMFCAGYDEGGKDTCMGDSGGPLVVAGIQIGVVSWGGICAAPKQPGAYTKLPVFEEYINSIIN
ncbi:unnamed protein product [Phyllotreta striolata]|uniref:Peptidase S1 domain-containing protein n=1 Tax=Phyllotreta striolata TaxID=444603 RepID=A0A9N9TTI0_PHYSR|nr:unnamed protein product [Phyllotreta striolata]